MAFMPTGFRALSALTRVQTRPWTSPHVLHLNARRLATVVDVRLPLSLMLSGDNDLTWYT
jgi:hypothetical protein